MRLSTRGYFAAAAAVAALAAASTFVLAAGGGAFRHRSDAPNSQCSAPDLAGTVVDVTLTNMGRMMMGSQAGGMMRVLVNEGHVAASSVSLRVANTGTLVHELVVLPLAAGQQVSDRVVGGDNRVAETGSVAEASRTCGEGSGDGIEPGALGWVTVTLAPGRYELVCNLAGHYAAGMYTELHVT